ncbi:MAG TPA: hypothetical protein VK638_11565 [Edaphobacter sp.]|nr:hypothetical protein [Edaphobacter sp.]
MQAVVLPGEGQRPTVSLSYIRRLYESAAPEIDIGTFRNSALVLVSDDLGGFHFDITGIFFRTGRWHRSPRAVRPDPLHFSSPGSVQYGR